MSLPPQDALLCEGHKGLSLDPAACRGQAAGGRCVLLAARGREACESGWRAFCARCCLFAQGQLQEGNRRQNFAKENPASIKVLEKCAVVDAPK